MEVRGHPALYSRPQNRQDDIYIIERRCLKRERDRETEREREREREREKERGRERAFKAICL